MITAKPKFPFRLGCTSYVYPDDILPNVRKMAPVVDDIELVLFESPAQSNLPDRRIVRELARIGRDNEVTFTVHFPIDRKAGSSDQAERRAFAATAGEIIALVEEPLRPFGYVLHLEGIDSSAGDAQRESWLRASSEVCAGLAGFAGLDAAKICVENLAYPTEWHHDLVKQHGFSFCLDLGHLWLNDSDWEATCRRFLPVTRIIHLHGVSGATDHCSLTKTVPRLVAGAVDTVLSSFTGVVTLEVFNPEDTFGSLGMIEELWRRSH